MGGEREEGRSQWIQKKKTVDLNELTQHIWFKQLCDGHSVA